MSLLKVFNLIILRIFGSRDKRKSPWNVIATKTNLKNTNHLQYYSFRIFQLYLWWTIFGDVWTINATLMSKETLNGLNMLHDPFKGAKVTSHIGNKMACVGAKKGILSIREKIQMIRVPST